MKPPSVGARDGTAAPTPRGLRVTDPETARVVAIHGRDGRIVGAGCLLSINRILTCRHVIEAALLPRRLFRGTASEVLVSLVGVEGQPTVRALVKDYWEGTRPQDDLAMLAIVQGPALLIPPVEFASAWRHRGKAYSVLGFPAGDPQGRNASGHLQGADAFGLLQMDRGGALSVLGGFSGAPVWSSDLNGFVGLVVREQSGSDVSWCIPSRILCRFYWPLIVRFRVPLIDRPEIHDRDVDDPNKELFGEIAGKDGRRLHVRLDPHDWTVNIEFECPHPPCGRLVTFLTYPDFKQKREDAYELFAAFKRRPGTTIWFAEQEFYPGQLFTVAGIAEGGETVLTCDLEALRLATKRKQKRPRQSH